MGQAQSPIDNKVAANGGKKAEELPDSTKNMLDKITQPELVELAAKLKQLLGESDAPVDTKESSGTCNSTVTEISSDDQPILTPTDESDMEFVGDEFVGGASANEAPSVDKLAAMLADSKCAVSNNKLSEDGSAPTFAGEDIVPIYRKPWTDNITTPQVRAQEAGEAASDFSRTSAFANDPRSLSSSDPSKDGSGSTSTAAVKEVVPVYGKPTTPPTDNLTTPHIRAQKVVSALNDLSKDINAAASYPPISSTNLTGGEGSASTPTKQTAKRIAKGKAPIKSINTTTASTLQASEFVKAPSAQASSSSTSAIAKGSGPLANPATTVKDGTARGAAYATRLPNARLARLIESVLRDIELVAVFHFGYKMLGVQKGPGFQAVCIAVWVLGFRFVEWADAQYEAEMLSKEKEKKEKQKKTGVKGEAMLFSNEKKETLSKEKNGEKVGMEVKLSDGKKDALSKEKKGETSDVKLRSDGKKEAEKAKSKSVLENCVEVFKTVTAACCLLLIVAVVYWMMGAGKTGGNWSDVEEIEYAAEKWLECMGRI